MTELLLFLVGPTASGKTRLALELSTRLNGEIVSMDSMQIYRKLDIGTAKPARAEQNAARHHLIDIKNADETYSAAQWADDARAAILKIRGRGKTPIVVGGTGFYARALLQPETLSSAPPNSALRAQLEDELQMHGAPHLHDRLRVLDANAAARLNVGDTRRVIRAIEIALSGFSATSHQSPVSDFQPLIFGLEWPRALLYTRIEERIEQMLRDGFMDELRFLEALNLPHDATAAQSLGYKQMRATLQDKTHDKTQFAAALEVWKRDTRRYAKRQMTWFRHQLPTRWLAVSDATNWPEIADFIAQQWNIEYSKRGQNA